MVIEVGKRDVLTLISIWVGIDIVFGIIGALVFSMGHWYRGFGCAFNDALMIWITINYLKRNNQI
jgi:hypothetical protein